MTIGVIGILMEQQMRKQYKPECPLAHNLINKLSVIVGNCDLLVERIPETSPLWDRMLLVRDMAKSVAQELGQLECDLLRLRTANDHKSSKASLV